MPGAVGAFAFIFILAASDYITPKLLGGVNLLFLTEVIASQFLMLGNFSLGAALCFLLLGTFVLVFLLLTRAERFKGV
jgi:ABC-type spermidine/putrescine transport system permease subunit I